MRIVVTRAGDVYFQNRRTSGDLLPEQIRESLKNGAERKIYLAVDSRTRYVDVESVLDNIRTTNIREICLVAEKPNQH